MLTSFEDTWIEKDDGQLWVRDRHGNIACEAFRLSEDETEEEMLNAGYVRVPYDFEGERVYVEVQNEEESEIMELEQLAKQHQLDEHTLIEALRYGAYDPKYSQQIGVTIVDDESRREYNQEWTIALVFELGGKRYGYYRDGAQTVLEELSDETTVAAWANQWDVEHLPALLAEVTQSERAYVSDSEAYEAFVGQITPREFVAPFDGHINAAIENLINTWCWDEPVPSWLESALFRYVEDKLEEQ